MYVLLLWIAKILQKTSRLAGNSGAALPGLFIEKVSPGFLAKGLKKLPEGVIVISGTNGKTTTTKIVADTLKHFGEKVLTNATGSNMTRGLVSSIVARSSWSGSLPYNLAVLEVDEAYAAVLAKQIPIRAALVLNVMRDQLDRFGEIDATAKLLGTLTEAATEFVVLNANDPRVVGLEAGSGVSRTYFAANPDLSKKLVSDDEWHGGKKKVNTRRPLVDFELVHSERGELSVQAGEETYQIHSHFQGLHNHLNLTASLTFLTKLLPKKSITEVIQGLQLTRPAFGRGEEVVAGDAKVTLLLVKNPSSFAQTLASTDPAEFDTTSVVINDAYADSRDVSWLWDVEVNDIARAKKVYTAGTRGLDMAVRLKYAEIRTTDTVAELSELISMLVAKPGSHAVFCTYTAMLELRKLLVKRGHLEQIV